MKRFLVIGAGVSGCTAALELARLGHHVTLLESGGRPGGKAVSYACKATDSCSRCGVCIAYSRIGDTLMHPRVTLLEGAQVEGARASAAGWRVSISRCNPHINRQECTGCGQCVAACPSGALSVSRRGGLDLVSVDFSSCLLHQGKSCSACADACREGAVSTGSARVAASVRADAVLLATGHENFSPAAKPRLGYGRVPGVISGWEAEKLLSRQTWLPDARGNAARSIAFIQCVGSRDPSLGRGFCSSVCCAASLRMARLLASGSPGAEVTVYSIDIQNFDKVFTPFRQELEALGIRFVRGTPFSVAPGASGRLSLRIEDPEAGRDAGQSSAEHDAVVLAAGIAPAASSGRLAQMFGLALDEFGFVVSAAETSTRGAFATGTCAEPQGILDCIASARATALEMLR